MNNSGFGAVIALVCVAGLSYAQSNAFDATAEQRDVRAAIEKFARLRNLHNGTAVAETYTWDADYIGWDELLVHGRDTLASMWNGVTGEARRTINSVDALTPNIAVVRVRAEFSDTPSVLNETFVVIWKDRQWLITTHEAALSPP